MFSTVKSGKLNGNVVSTTLKPNCQRLLIVFETFSWPKFTDGTGSTR